MADRLSAPNRLGEVLISMANGADSGIENPSVSWAALD
jgi:hypothetical protein